MEANRKATGPRVLDGVRVLDFTSVIAGPYCTRLMADLGAEVLKIEPPGGEFARHVPPMRQGRQRRVQPAQLRQEEPVSRSQTPRRKPTSSSSWVRTYDVVVENFSPGVMARLGLDYAALSQVNPAVIMCSISGYGQTGPGAATSGLRPGGAS